MDSCKYCGRDTVYGDHPSCKYGSKEDQEMMKQAMRGYPETLYYVQGKQVTKEEQQAYFEANRKGNNGQS